MTGTADAVVYRSVRFRLRPGEREKAERLEEFVRNTQRVWNETLHHRDVARARATDAGEDPPKLPSRFDLSLQLTTWRASCEWLRGTPVVMQRGALMRQADAFRAAAKGQRGWPRRQGRHSAQTISIEQDVRIEGDRLWVPGAGWYTLAPRRGGNPYADCPPRKVTIFRDGKRWRWYAAVVYAVPAARVARPDDDLCVGVDMNTPRQAVATSDGTIIPLPPEIDALAEREARHQRCAARKKKGSRRWRREIDKAAGVKRKAANIRADWQHRVSRQIVETAGLVAVEDLTVKGMTASAKGTVDAPGKNVKQKAGLNREILRVGWAGLRAKIEYKATRSVAVPPAYTSQRCHRCGAVDAASRKTQARYECSQCGWSGNADVNAARNIAAAGAEIIENQEKTSNTAPGTGASRRRGVVLSGGPDDPRTKHPQADF